MNIFIIFTSSLSFILHPGHGFKGFEVIQPRNQTVNPDGSAFIRCQHAANVISVLDVRLSSIYPTEKPKCLCQKGMKTCKNIILHEENPNNCLFILLNIGPEAMKMTYQCEFTVKKGELDYTGTGTPTILLPGEKETANQPSPPPESHLDWILMALLALLALMFLYSCVISLFYLRQRCSKTHSENNYVEMRKAPPPRNPPPDMIYG